MGNPLTMSSTSAAANMSLSPTLGVIKTSYLIFKREVVCRLTLELEYYFNMS